MLLAEDDMPTLASRSLGDAVNRPDRALARGGSPPNRSGRMAGYEIEINTNGTNHLEH